MATIDEAVLAKTPLGSDLAAGVDSLSLDQEILFTRYIRLILPLDGYAFWVKSSMVGPSALYNAMLMNKVRFGGAPNTFTVAPTLIAKGSLHYATDTRQEAEETYAANLVVFTSEEEVNDLSDMAPNTLWIGEFDGKRFAFSSRASFYRQADLFHYVGFAVYPDMATQIIDSPVGFDSQNVIVSNSLPAWLALNGYVPAYGFGNPSIRLYPSFLVPDNLEPQFGAVDVQQATTRALQSAPRLDPKTSTHSQLCAETVKVTLWGTRNFSAMDFLDCVYQYSADFGIIGIMNMPVPQDEKRTQSELGTIAMKKSLTFEISYNQSAIRNIAQQIINSAIPNIYVNGTPA